MTGPLIKFVIKFSIKFVIRFKPNSFFKHFHRWKLEGAGSSSDLLEFFINQPGPKYSLALTPKKLSGSWPVCLPPPLPTPLGTEIELGIHKPLQWFTLLMNVLGQISIFFDYNTVYIFPRLVT